MVQPESYVDLELWGQSREEGEAHKGINAAPPKEDEVLLLKRGEDKDAAVLAARRLDKITTR